MKNPGANPSPWPQVSTLLSAALAMYAVIWFMQLGIRRPFLGAIRIEMVWAIALLIMAVLSPRDRTSIFSHSGVRWALALVVLMGLRVIISEDVEVSWFVYFNRVLKFAVMGLFVMMIVRDPRSMKWFLGGMLFAWFYITQESFRGGLTGSLVWENQGIPRLHGTTPLYLHPNSLAGLAIGALPFVYFLVPVVKSKIAKLFLTALAITSGGCLLYSGSRTGYLAGFFFLLGVFLHSRHKLRFVVIAAVLGVAAAPFVPEAYVERFSTIFAEKEARGGSAEKRIEILKDAVEIFKQNPLGVGVAAFPKVREDLFGRVQDTHNLYLEVATNLGVPGLILFGGLLLSVGRSLGRSRQRLTAVLNELRLSAFAHDVRFLLAVTSAAQVYLLVRLALGLFGHDLYEIYWWLLLGLAVALDRMSLHLVPKP
jgi:O-antigen ligase